MPCCFGKCAPTALSGGLDIPEVAGFYLLRQMSSL